MKNCNPHEFFYDSFFDYTNVIKTDFGESIGVIANLSGILVYTVIKKLEVEKNENTKVDLNGEVFRVNNQITNSPILADTLGYMQESRNAKLKISDKEVSKIVKKLRQKGNLSNTEIYRHKKIDKKLKGK